MSQRVVFFHFNSFKLSDKIFNNRINIFRVSLPKRLANHLGSQSQAGSQSVSQSDSFGQAGEQNVRHRPGYLSPKYQKCLWETITKKTQHTIYIPYIYVCWYNIYIFILLIFLQTRFFRRKINVFFLCNNNNLWLIEITKIIFSEHINIKIFIVLCVLYIHPHIITHSIVWLSPTEVHRYPQVL